jgi:transcriptional regulator with XRE-family HTH domain
MDNEERPMAKTAENARQPARELLSGNLIFQRARAGLSQTGLADASGLSRQTISEIERGATNPSIDVIDRIVDALGITIDKLFVVHQSGLVDDDELERRRASGREDTVNAFELLDAIEEVAGRPRRFSNAGRPRLRR